MTAGLIQTQPTSASINPATGEVLAEFAKADDAQVAQAVDAADSAFTGWSKTPIAERAKVIARVAEIYKERLPELVETISQEMGKRAREAKGEVIISSLIMKYYAEHAERMLADEPVETFGTLPAVVQRRPLGALLGVMPWNFPLYQVVRFAAPNLMAGNTIVLKHADSCPRTATVIEEIFAEAGLPTGAYVKVFASHQQVDDIIADPRIHGVSLTGSEGAGASVAQSAGKHLKKVVLELGGSDPYLVLDSEDVAESVDTAYEIRMMNMGQACNGPKRMIVMSDIYDAFVEKLRERVLEYSAGDPLDKETTLAPLSSQQAANTFVDQIERAEADGATVLAGGGHIEGPGAYVEPTLLVDVKPGTVAYSEEIFGPAFVVFRVESDDAAVALANDTDFGLGATVFSTDVERARRVGDEINAGMVFVNNVEESREFLPFGGIKRSGFGRELGPWGIEEFLNKRLVRVKDDA
ncbi:NAD-dependent succinate-semialdehyde dehydrogenase [Brevibacterium jeotgali]|uniref:Succinate-semialdehyde dehydrogenase / glutarate-semialdehyde dehydrogenase n=1 Tax=Brevibacterium jeotgali TaxID=1262550 RepID=A0A2H1L783_9MICO|nr:NAD-dependent succinate-semialdehyde dehydrogenase [Brevibacterium jeotgali]TWC02323.1 succinate-semialdehyde dehydrogenase/glutarate-semialdehyde dehydrogenase [Brevibacterium jeotgali]SMY12625.1 succinate-semialdehyde dehydrogenase / glutarate-semialdehyde dehydrogenase [Brevibacterium jeotgali]